MGLARLIGNNVIVVDDGEEVHHSFEVLFQTDAPRLWKKCNPSFNPRLINPRRRSCSSRVIVAQLIALGIHPDEVMKASRCRRGYWPRKHSGLVGERERDRAARVGQRVAAATRRAGLEVTMDRTALRRGTDTNGA